MYSGAKRPRASLYDPTVGSKDYQRERVLANSDGPDETAAGAANQRGQNSCRYGAKQRTLLKVLADWVKWSLHL